MVFDGNAGTGAPGVHHGDVVPADLPLDKVSVLLAEGIGVAAGDFPLTPEDGVNEDGIRDDQVRQQQVGFFPGAPADVVGVAGLEPADVFQVHPVPWVVVGHRHSLEGSQGFRGEDLLLRPENGDQGVPGIFPRGKPQLLGQVFLGSRPGHRHVQAQQVPFRLPAGDVFRQPCSVVKNVLFLLSIYGSCCHTP